MEKKKLLDIFENTINGDIKYDKDLENIDYYSLIFKAASQNILYSLGENNFCMFNYEYENEDAVLMVFSTPINSTNGVKIVAEKIMSIVELLENTFIELDFIKAIELKEEKFIYITAVKRVKEEED